MSEMQIREILDYLPHRYPFMLIDRVLEVVPGERLRALKNVTFNEPFFQGHFPHVPVMPGVLIIEAMAQATGILAFKTAQTQPSAQTLYYFVGVDSVRFKQRVVPGDQLVLDVRLLRTVRGVWKFATEAKVDGKLVAAGELMCAERDT